jgi:dTDP-4-dehydrorhamnose reductase
MKMKILVTGASGLLGANLVLAALERGHSPTALDRAHPANFPGTTWLQEDLLEATTAERCISKSQADWVVHCAAWTNVDACQSDGSMAHRLNVEASESLAEAARKKGAGFIYISTDSVFDGERGRYREEDATGPVNVYAQTKLEGEIAVLRSHPNAIVARTNIYGWNLQPKESLAEWILHRLQQRQPLQCFDDVLFSPILVNDLSDALLDMMDRGLSGVYHVCGGEPCSKYAFACKLANVFQIDSSAIQAISVADFGFKAPRPRNTTLDTTRIAEALGRAMPDVRNGLKRFDELWNTGFVARLQQMRA